MVIFSQICCISKGGLHITSYNFFPRGGRDLRFCMTDDDGHYETKKSNISRGAGRRSPPEKFGEFTGDFENFSM